MRWIRAILLLVAFLLFGSHFVLQSYADVSASLTVPPRISDFQFSFQGDTANNVPQNTVINYTITYGAYTSAHVNTTQTITVDYSHDMDTNGTHVLNYIIGSATKGYNNTSPVVDTTNRTITWTIPNFPNGTIDQTVSFQLETTNGSTQTSPVNFTVNATITNQYVHLPQQQVSGSYLFSGNPVPTATPTPVPAPTNTPAPNPSPTPLPSETLQPTPTPIPASNPLRIVSVDITGINQNAAQISVTTTKPSKVTILYGTATNVTRSVATADFAQVTSIMLETLTPDTPYFFQVQLVDQTGQTLTSETFTFTTAQVSTPPTIDQTSLVLLSKGNILVTTSIRSQKQLANIVLPTHHAFTVALSLPASIKKPTVLEAILRPKTLGATTAYAITELQTIIVPLIQQADGLYIANFLTPTAPGIYTISAHIEDASGNVIEQPLAEIRVSLPLQVLTMDTKQPIRDARIFLSGYNLRTKQFESITNLINSIQNLAFTDVNGIYAIALPQGTYTAVVSALGYQTKTVTFTLGNKADQIFPVIYLAKRPGSLLSLSSYLITNAQDDMLTFWNNLLILTASHRFGQLLSVLICFFFILLTFLSFLLRTHLHPRNFIHFLHFHATMQQNNYVQGVVIDENKQPISQATILLTDNATHNVQQRLVTDKSGLFYFQQVPEVSYIITAIKEGFVMESTRVIEHQPLVLLLEKNMMNKQQVKHVIMHFILSFFAMFFETFLVLSLLIEWLVFRQLGQEALVFVFLSGVNLILWVLFIKQHKMRKNLL